MKKQVLPVLTILLVLGLFGVTLPSGAQPSGQAATGTATAGATLSATASATAEPFTRLNLNTATSDQFLTISKVNNRWVREFMEYRPYVSIQQYRKEISKYVGDEQTAEWEKSLYVPIQVDNSDAATLKQIPGVDDAIAKTLMAARPFKTNEAFLTKLATILTPAQTVYAANYLDGTVTIPAEIKAGAAAATPAATSAATLAATAAN